MTMTRRPRVAAIGLDDAQASSIESLCGELRSAQSLYEYQWNYSWTETDVVVSSALNEEGVDYRVNLLAIGPNFFHWSDSSTEDYIHFSYSVVANTSNTERELAVPLDCPDPYRPLAVELSRQLSHAAKPPTTIAAMRRRQTTLIETTSGRPVALRVVLPARPDVDDSNQSTPIALLLPEESNLAAWFRAFLFDIHESDPASVPEAPPRLSQLSDWYTPQELHLADRITQIDLKLDRLSEERDRFQAELAMEGERAEQGARLALYADGDDLTASAWKMFADLGFTVRDMDAGLSQGQPKREDLRLTLEGNPGWEAIVEVKGYTRGTRTSDSRQIREYRERYIREEGGSPDLTVWLSNPHRSTDPSARPDPDRNVQEVADAIGAVHLLVTDLYRQWVLVETGRLDAEAVIRSLQNAKPGLWTPPTTDSSH